MGRAAILAGKLAPGAAFVLLAGSTGLGLLFVVAVGFGYLPALGGTELSLAPLKTLFADQRILSSCVVTIAAGLCATLAAVLTAFAMAAAVDPGGTIPTAWPQRLALVVLAMPHAALALGLAFVIAPSGWLMRMLNAMIGTWPRPPDWSLLSGEAGHSLALALYLKETPFLFFAMATALRQLRPERHLLAAQTLGYSNGMTWLKVILPRLYPLVRFPILAVLAYSLSVVDMSLILGPTTPATLPVLILKWANDADLNNRFLAAAAALLQLGLVMSAIMAWWLGERAVIVLARRSLSDGRRHLPQPVVRIGRAVLLAIAAVGAALVVLSISALLLWSLADVWRYPDLLPDELGWSTWRRSIDALTVRLLNSVGLALGATLLAMLLSIACLEHERSLRFGVARSAEKWLFLPLLVPEICFLLGLQVLLLVIGQNGTLFAVLWMHLLFVFPYVFLTLKESWRAFDSRYETVGLALGRGRWHVLWHVKVPMLRAALSWAAAIGCTVSLSLYLPTVQGGEGRVATLATEAVALGGGGDRRISGVFGVLQALVAASVFLLALRAARVGKWQPA